jgi:hypothetical protein
VPALAHQPGGGRRGDLLVRHQHTVSNSALKPESLPAHCRSI